MLLIGRKGANVSPPHPHYKVQSNNIACRNPNKVAPMRKRWGSNTFEYASRGQNPYRIVVVTHVLPFTSESLNYVF